MLLGAGGKLGSRRAGSSSQEVAGVRMVVAVMDVSEKWVFLKP